MKVFNQVLLEEVGLCLSFELQPVTQLFRYQGDHKTKKQMWVKSRRSKLEQKVSQMQKLSWMNTLQVFVHEWAYTVCAISMRVNFNMWSELDSMLAMFVRVCILGQNPKYLTLGAEFLFGQPLGQGLGVMGMKVKSWAGIQHLFFKTTALPVDRVLKFSFSTVRFQKGFDSVGRLSLHLRGSTCVDGGPWIAGLRCDVWNEEECLQFWGAT